MISTPPGANFARGSSFASDLSLELSTNAAILVNSALRQISSARTNWLKPPVGPRTRTDVKGILGAQMFWK